MTEDASTERGNLSAIRHQGLICKQGRVVRSRKWRYFVLDDHAIKYYKDRFHTRQRLMRWSPQVDAVSHVASQVDVAS